MRSRSEEALAAIIGKVVSGIVLTENPGNHPRSQVYLTFSDGTSFELWGDDETICTASGFDHHSLDDIVAIQSQREGTKVKAFRPPHEDPDQPQQDLLTKAD